MAQYLSGLRCVSLEFNAPQSDREHLWMILIHQEGFCATECTATAEPQQYISPGLGRQQEGAGGWLHGAKNAAPGYRHTAICAGSNMKHLSFISSELHTDLAEGAVCRCVLCSEPSWLSQHRVTEAGNCRQPSPWPEPQHAEPPESWRSSTVTPHHQRLPTWPRIQCCSRKWCAA